nr:ABC transporter permease [uncultured Agathobaculum sp.]
MSVRDLFRMAVGGLRENRLRTVLCALSVAVGAAALLLIAALGLMGQQKLAEGIRTLGVSGLTVYVDDRGAGQALSAAVADTMAQAVSGVECAMPIKALSGTVRAGHAGEDVLFLGVDERLGEVMQLDVLAGSLLTRAQAQAAQPVAVVGDDLAQALYGRDNIVGRTIRLRLGGCDQDFTVCGVVHAQTSALGTAVASLAPHLVYIPYGCLATQTQSADQVFVQCLSGADLSAVSGRISRYLTDRVQVDGTVRVQNMSGIAETVNRMAELGVGLFVAVGGVALCVALLGVMSGMLAAAQEKTGEIGVLLAIGAQPRDIRHLFLLQSTLLCAVGGLMGAGGVLALLRAAAVDTPALWLTAALLALCVACGAAAGLLPAVRAARLDPIEAMRK